MPRDASEKFNLSCLFMNIFRIQNWCLVRYWSWRCRHFRTKRRNKFACSKISSSMSAMLFALIFPRAQLASTFDIYAEWNVWLQSTLRSFAIVCDYMETALFAIVCDRLRSYGNQPLENYVVDWMHPKSFGTFEKWGPKSRSRWHVIHGVEIEFPKLFSGSSLARDKYFTRGLRA